MSEQSKKQMTYADAGVDIDAGNRAVELMKESVRATYRPEVIGDLGGFGGLFALNSGKYQEPILVSGTAVFLSVPCLALFFGRHYPYKSFKRSGSGSRIGEYSG